ncbi:unnamed protein product [Gongylonema pulchrum]|uniref:Uncharacterized protein n=1 Tax=Gongylonema pulchrum TaxID=637853 RepID=A0A183EX32_9BILA|nr:unnamed protein product [Gongylonema pulchrum]
MSRVLAISGRSRSLRVDLNDFADILIAVILLFQGPIVPQFCVQPEPVDLDYKFKLGSTKILKQKEIKYDVIESMDISH